MTHNPKTSLRQTNIPWIWEIPKDWEVKKLKFIGKIVNWSTPTSSEKDYWDWEIDWITPTDLGNTENPNLYQSGRKITQLWLENCGTTMVPENSIILSCRAPIWSLGITKKKMCTNQGCKALITNSNMLYKYVFYHFIAWNEYLQSLWKWTTFQELSTTEFENSQFISPPPSIQSAIANFLDQKTEKISTLISNKKKLIDLLQEQKQSIIHRAVTKGIDENVEMKVSGIPWIWEIPEDWEVSKLKLFSKIYSWGTPDKSNPDYWENWTIPWLNSGTVNQFIIDEASEYITEEWLKWSSTKWIPINSVVIALAGQWKTKWMVGLTTFETTCNQSLWVIVPGNKIDSKYLLYYLHQDYSRIRWLAGDDIRDGLNLEVVWNIPLLIPNKSSQINIIQYIEKETSQVDAAIATIEKEITLIEEYRTSLIYQAVTGKISIL